MPYLADDFEPYAQWIKALNEKLKETFAKLDTHGCTLLIVVRARFPVQTVNVSIYAI